MALTLTSTKLTVSLIYFRINEIALRAPLISYGETKEAVNAENMSETFIVNAANHIPEPADESRQCKLQYVDRVTKRHYFPIFMTFSVKRCLIFSFQTFVCFLFDYEFETVKKSKLQAFLEQEAPSSL